MANMSVTSRNVVHAVASEGSGGGAGEFCQGLRVIVDGEFEECLKLRWELEAGPSSARLFREFVIEMALDRANPDGHPDDARLLKPAADAMVKRVSMGKDKECAGCIQNMPTGRSFLVAVVGLTHTDVELRSRWMRARTLSDKTREARLGNIDPMNMPRKNCKACSCPGYVPVRWGLNSACGKICCRRCACPYTDHVVVELDGILRAREERACASMKRSSVKPLPQDALEWDGRECSLWFWTDGQLHPRTSTGEQRKLPQPEGRSPAACSDRHACTKGRVSVVTPTTQSRQQFHEMLWKCFEAQAWEDKELVVVETYQHQHSEFFMKLAKKDHRLVYLKYEVPADQDWSIGVKRNIAAHFASGEFLANFDDDDLYAPSYLSSMLRALEDRSAQAITLSTWYIYDCLGDKFHFCDPIAWGLASGRDQNDHEVRSRTYGYGFSYVFRRKVGLDLLYENVNMGEDFQFITHLLHRRGDSSVALLRDDFGICLHLQHGANTSNSMPLREVDHEEAMDLDIMELALHLQGRGSWSSTRLGSLLASAEPPSTRDKWVRGHATETNVLVRCSFGATTSEFLQCLEEQHPTCAVASCGSLKRWCVYRVPLADETSPEEGSESAVQVLGLGFLTKVPEVKERLASSSSPCGKQWRQLLAGASEPMKTNERLGLRTRSLWLRPPPLDGGVREEADVADEDEQEQFVIVRATCQKSTVKKFFTVSGAVQARLLLGGDVASLRWVLDGDFPSDARVLAELPGRGLSTLLGTDVVPERVVLTDFAGRRNFYAKFTKRECKLALTMITDFFRRPDSLDKLLELGELSKGNQGRYGMMLCQLLADEVYPPILRALGLPDDQQPLHLIMSGLEMVGGEPELCALWLQSELLMHNYSKIREAYDSLSRLHAERGLPVPPEPQPEPVRLQFAPF